MDSGRAGRPSPPASTSSPLIPPHFRLEPCSHGRPGDRVALRDGIKDHPDFVRLDEHRERDGAELAVADAVGAREHVPLARVHFEELVPEERDAEAAEVDGLQ
jgi:hypothetical protein